MPRKAPQQVIEHRITLGDFERKEIKERLDSQDRLNNVKAIQQGVTSAAYLGGAAAMTWLGYQTWLIVSGKSDAQNQTGGYLWDSLLYRAGALSSEEYAQSIANRREKEEQSGAKGGFFRWLVGGSDEKFFFWDI